MHAALRFSVCLVAVAMLLPGARLRAEDQPKPQYEHGAVKVPAATADEARLPAISVPQAVAYLEQGQTAWGGARKCVSCHTNGIYLTVMPALSKQLGPPSAEARKFFVDRLAQKSASTTDDLRRSTNPAQVIYIAAGLAEWDRHVSGKRSAETDAAIELMLKIQEPSGTWGSLGCWPPYESDAYHLATVAAMTLAAAPGWRESPPGDSAAQEAARARVARLTKYLRETKPLHDYSRVLKLWASQKMPGLLEPADAAEIAKLLAAKQRADGGWSLRNFAKPEEWGNGSRAGKLQAEPDFADPASDGHMTGLAIVVLRGAGVPTNDAGIQKGLAWIKTNQRESGRWWTRSLNTDTFHFITYSGTAFPLLALATCDELPVTASKQASGGR